MSFNRSPSGLGSLSPVPGGEGWGEGELAVSPNTVANQVNA